MIDTKRLIMVIDMNKIQIIENRTKILCETIYLVR